jgi:mRNA-degrading endonuclease YafQ of YafQ-DinJ toxin-antitoxin module
MEETTGAPAAADTAPVESTPAPVDEVAAATPENAGNRAPMPNKYKREVENLLVAYEAKQARLATERAEAERNQPEPEPQGLLEGESWDSIYAAQPPEAQRAMAELRKAFTKKTQELAAEKRKIEAQNKAFSDSGLIDELRSQAGKVPEDFDPFNAEHIQQLIEAKVASRLQQVLEPLHKKNQQHAAAAKYTTFKEAHPDLTGDPIVKQGVYKALQANPNLKLEDAYWAVKGRIAEQNQRQAAERKAVRDRAARRAASVPSTGRRPGQRVVSPELKKQSAWEIYNALKDGGG